MVSARSAVQHHLSLGRWMHLQSDVPSIGRTDSALLREKRLCIRLRDDATRGHTTNFFRSIAT